MYRESYINKKILKHTVSKDNLIKRIKPKIKKKVNASTINENGVYLFSVKKIWSIRE